MACANHGLESLCGQECEGYIWGTSRARRVVEPADMEDHAPHDDSTPIAGLAGFRSGVAFSQEDLVRDADIAEHMERSQPEGPRYPEPDNEGERCPSCGTNLAR